MLTSEHVNNKPKAKKKPCHMLLLYSEWEVDGERERERFNTIITDAPINAHTKKSITIHPSHTATPRRNGSG